MRRKFNLKSEVGRGDLTQFVATAPSTPQDSASGDMFMALLALRQGGAGRERHLPASSDAALRAAFGRLSRSARLSDFAVFKNTTQPSSCHLGSASCAISSLPTSEFRFNLNLNSLRTHLRKGAYSYRPHSVI